MKAKYMMSLSSTCKHMRVLIYSYVRDYVMKPLYAQKILEIYNTMDIIRSIKPDHSIIPTLNQKLVNLLRKTDKRVTREYALWFMRCAMLDVPPHAKQQTFWFRIAKEANAADIDTLIDYLCKNDGKEDKKESWNRIMSILYL